ncbi:MAG: hypothetical protein Q7S95_01200 [bacterium]|nr:hypothetical protein [bacterium]
MLIILKARALVCALQATAFIGAYMVTDDVATALTVATLAANVVFDSSAAYATAALATALAYGPGAIVAIIAFSALALAFAARAARKWGAGELRPLPFVAYLPLGIGAVLIGIYLWRRNHGDDLAAD